MTPPDGYVALPVIDVHADTRESVVVTFDAPGLGFAHGQHLNLRRVIDGEEVRRSYSICSPAPRGALRIAIKRIDGGVFSTWATTKLAVGDTIDVMSPRGHFTHDPDPAARRRYTLLAAGSGITPILSIAATVLEVEARSSVDLLCVNRSADTTMLLEDLEDLRDRHLGRFRLAYLFTREPAAADLLTGRPGSARLRELVAAGLLPAGADFTFLCGPPDLVASAAQALVDAGTPGHRIRQELFGAPIHERERAHATTADVRIIRATGTARLHGRTSIITIHDDETVLEATLRTRRDAPYSCRAGVCSTCQAKLVSGEVEMDASYGLSAQELQNGFILTCQARPMSPDFAVDYDI
jgi:ring-1,2-phenylacetyl-CoA epoxidase subunit PaaE